jgi:hypothetical protein
VPIAGIRRGIILLYTCWEPIPSHIAAQYSVSTGVLQRHKKDHLAIRPVEVQRARYEALRQTGEQVVEEARAEVIQSCRLPDQVHHHRLKTLSLLEQAERAGELRTALAGIEEARGSIELPAKIEGQLDERLAGEHPDQCQMDRPKNSHYPSPGAFP